MSQPQPPTQHSTEQATVHPHYYYPQQQEDEIDLRELFAALWQGKWIIIACTLVCTVLAIVYALIAKEQWSSTAKIAQPQVSDYSEYQNQVMQFQPIFDVYQDDGTVLVSNALQGLTQANSLYRLFIDEFNSSSNKKAFLETSPVFQKDKDLLDDSSNEDSVRKLYYDWYKLLSIKPEDAKQLNSTYVMTASAETSQDSFDMLKSYIQFIDEKVHRKVINNLVATISSKENELHQQSIMLTKQAQQRLIVEKERSEYALTIAQAAGVTKPLQNFGDKELFAINLGSDALKAKVEALSKVKNLSVIEPRLEQLNSKLEQIEKLKINDGIRFSAYSYLEQPEKMVFRDKPKRAVITFFGLLLGGGIGIVFVMCRFVFTRKK